MNFRAVCFLQNIYWKLGLKNTETHTLHTQTDTYVYIDKKIERCKQIDGYSFETRVVCIWNNYTKIYKFYSLFQCSVNIFTDYLHIHLLPSGKVLQTEWC